VELFVSYAAASAAKLFPTPINKEGLANPQGLAQA